MKHIKFIFFLAILFILSFLVRIFLDYEQYRFSNWRNSLFFSFWTTVGLYIVFLLRNLVDKLSKTNAGDKSAK